MCKDKQLSNMTRSFVRLTRESHNAIPEPCTTMEIVVVPQIRDKEENGKTLSLKVYFKAKYTEINQEKVRNNTWSLVSDSS